jgi:hypothetical protein
LLLLAILENFFQVTSSFTDNAWANTTGQVILLFTAVLSGKKNINE